MYASEGMPKLIPKIIHQTYKSMRVPEAMKPFMASWRLKNQDWEIRFYDDAACLSFVQREFPEYLEAYKALPKDVERSDFFRWVRHYLPQYLTEAPQQLLPCCITPLRYRLS